MLADWEQQRPDLSAQVQRIRFRLVVLGSFIARDNNMIARDYGLTGGEMRILYALRRAGEPFTLRPTDLQDLLLMPSPTVTRQVDRLAELGFLRRSRDEKDRRGFNVYLTQRGLAIADAALTRSVAESSMSKALNAMNAEEREELDRALTNLYRLLDEAEYMSND